MIDARQGCGVAGLRSLPDRSVGLLLTDPPSGETKAANDVVPDLDGFWEQVERVCSGRVVIICSSLRFVEIVRASATVEPARGHDAIWVKGMATGHLNASICPMRSHEHVLVHGKGPFNPQFGEAEARSGWRRGGTGENYGDQARSVYRGGSKRHPRTDLHFPGVGTSSAERRHHQQKPLGLLAYLIRTYSDPVDLVVDPFAGSFSTGVAALQEGRRFVGWDLDASRAPRQQPLFGPRP